MESKEKIDFSKMAAALIEEFQAIMPYDGLDFLETIRDKKSIERFQEHKQWG